MINSKENEIKKEIVNFNYAFKNIKTGVVIFTNNFFSGRNYVLLNIRFEDILEYERD